jgi:phosphoethanolamine N-methyltransferase
VSLEGKSVLDIGCGVGGVDVLLATTYKAGYVLGIDVQDNLLETARKRVADKGLASRCGFAKVWPGPLPFPPQTFDVVFSKDAIVHIPDKHALIEDVSRVLKPGGIFIASDWLIGHDGEPSPAMTAYLEAEGLDFGMASPGQYKKAMQQAGFTNISVTSRNDWYRETAKRELAQMKGPLFKIAVAKLGRDFVDHNIEIWTRMLPVLETGEHCPSHLRAQKPDGKQ